MKTSKISVRDLLFFLLGASFIAAVAIASDFDHFKAGLLGKPAPTVYSPSE
ncbi:MAG: hypothetical protein LPK07_11280 [Hymenobacteraceae bacterium]|nr:hypothetical protein [Hymenobacteraceae bacterium]